MCEGENMRVCVCAHLCINSVSKEQKYELCFKGIQLHHFQPRTSKPAMPDNVLVNRNPLALILNADTNQLWFLVNRSFQAQYG